MIQRSNTLGIALIVIGIAGFIIFVPRASRLSTSIILIIVGTVALIIQGIMILVRNRKKRM